MRISDWSSDVCSSDLRVDVRSDSQKPAERKHGIGHLAGMLVDHHGMNAAQLFAFGIEYRRAFHTGRRNQLMAFIKDIFEVCVRHHPSPTVKKLLTSALYHFRSALSTTRHSVVKGNRWSVRVNSG